MSSILFHSTAKLAHPEHTAQIQTIKLEIFYLSLCNAESMFRMSRRRSRPWHRRAAALKSSSTEGTSSKCLSELGRNGITYMYMYMKLDLHTKLQKASRESSCWHCERGHRICGCTSCKGTTESPPREQLPKAQTVTGSAKPAGWDWS